MVQHRPSIVTAADVQVLLVVGNQADGVHPGPHHVDVPVSGGPSGGAVVAPTSLYIEHIASL
jgi:hypothetical protein